MKKEYVLDLEFVRESDTLYLNTGFNKHNLRDEDIATIKTQLHEVITTLETKNFEWFN